MLKVESLTLGPLETNTYLVWDEAEIGDNLGKGEKLEALVIDPADDGDFISERILELQISPKAVVLTHGHIDHLMGAFEVCINFDLPLYLHSADEFLIKRAVATAKHWFGREIAPPPSTLPLNSDNAFTIGKHVFEILEIPGHTPGSVALHNSSSQSEPIAFAGDLIFAEGYGRTDLAYSNSLQLFDSVEKLKTNLPKGVTIYPGHGEAFYL